MIDLQPNLDLTIDDAERMLGAWLGDSVSCSGISRLDGGLVNSVFGLEFDRPPFAAVVKLHGRDGDSFADEARSLAYLKSETSCPVPRVYLQDSTGQVLPAAFLLMERVPGVCLKNLDLDAADRSEVDRQLATVLAELHEHRATWWGNVDAGRAATTWGEVFAGRLAAARELPAVADRLLGEVLDTVDQALDRVSTFITDGGRPTLVHGDVWDGNLMVARTDGRWRITGLLDPDLQFADAEYELAYLEVFDGSRDVLFASYTTRHPLRAGYHERRLFYWLHTALVHVALFGDDYFCDFTARTARSITALPQP